MFLLISIVISQYLDNRPTTLYVANDDGGCHLIKNHECHAFSFYANFSFPSNTALIFLPGIHVLPGNFIGFPDFNNLVIRGNSGAGEEKAKLINVSMVIANSRTVRLKNLEIPSLMLINNGNIEACSMFFKGLTAVNSTNILICNTSCYSMILINAVVQLENVIASASHKVVAVILIDGIGNHSNLSNITVKCDGRYALAVTGRHDTHSSYINIRDITVTGGKILFKNVHSHLSVSNVKATVYQNNSCNYTVLSVLDCGSYMSITNVAVDGGRVIIVIAGSHFIFKNFTVNIKTTFILTRKIFRCYLLFIYGSLNSHHVNITGVRVTGGGTISVSEINSNLNINDIYTNVGLNVGFNGNNINIGNSYVVGIMRLLYNGNNITLRNITVGYIRDKAIGLSNDDDLLWNASALSVRSCGSYISVSNVTIFNGITVLHQNKDNIFLQDVRVYIKSSFNITNAKKFLDPNFDIQPIGLMVEQNHRHIIIKNIKIWNGSIAVVSNDNDITVLPSGSAWLPSGSAWYVGLSWTSAPQNGCHPRSI